MYKPSKKPEKTGQYCLSCGKELTEWEVFFGACACAMPIKPEEQPYKETGTHTCKIGNSVCHNVGFCTGECESK